MSRSPDQVRLLTSDDLPYITRLLNTSEYVYQRFTLEELPSLLKHYPTVGLINGTSLRGFLLSQTVNAPSAWLGGVCWGAPPRDTRRISVNRASIVAGLASWKPSTMS